MMVRPPSPSPSSPSPSPPPPPAPPLPPPVAVSARSATPSNQSSHSGVTTPVFGLAMLFLGGGWRATYDPSSSSHAPTIRHGTGSLTTNRNTRFFAVPSRDHTT